MEKINYGYVRKIEIHSGRLLGFYSYPELLINPMLRSRLKAELECTPGCGLFCACSDRNDKQVCINDSYSLCFPDGALHEKKCVSYLKTLEEYVSPPLMKELVSAKPCLQASFKWTSGSRLSHKVIKATCLSIQENDRISLEDFVKYTNLRVFFQIAMEIYHSTRHCYPSFSEFMQIVTFEFGKCTLIDKSGATFPITSKTLFRTYLPPGTVSFLYGKVIYVNRSYKSKLYFTAQYSGGEAMFEMDHSRWDFLEPDIDPDLPLYICGFVRTSKGTGFRKGKRDSITHTYQGAVAKQRETHQMLSFILFHANTYGLICCDKEMYRKTNLLCEEGSVCYLPFFPVIS